MAVVLLSCIVIGRNGLETFVSNARADWCDLVLSQFIDYSMRKRRISLHTDYIDNQTLIGTYLT